MDLSQFEKLLQESSLSEEIQKKFLLLLQKQDLQNQVFLLQIFEKYPEKIPAFWEICKKKFDFFKDGIGTLDAIVEEEIQLFS